MEPVTGIKPQPLSIFFVWQNNLAYVSGNCHISHTYKCLLKSSGTFDVTWKLVMAFRKQIAWIISDEKGLELSSIGIFPASHLWTFHIESFSMSWRQGFCSSKFFHKNYIINYRLSMIDDATMRRTNDSKGFQETLFHES